MKKLTLLIAILSFTFFWGKRTRVTCRLAMQVFAVALLLRILSSGIYQSFRKRIKQNLLKSINRMGWEEKVNSICILEQTSFQKLRKPIL
ncbi:hypothetical protein [Chryseobacterium piperi]|uniref:hypothetical protein n=1 Tax=Chryseobacterium piperi TaxID=558152 RepID=UPI001E51D69F|nr:hypothetical protein [Chryseobacterium piperi]